MGLFSDLYNHSCPTCLESSIKDFVASEFLSTTNVLNEVIRDFSQGNTEVVNTKLYDLYYNNLNKGIRNVFKPESKNISDLNYYYKFDANASKFAAYKSNFVAIKLGEMIGDKDYDLKAKALLKRFNRFQMAEYNTTVSRCRTAKQFAKFKKTDSYANIEWLRTRSASPRELHLSFAGLVLPKNHAFWTKNQPGNLYQCKCDWRLTNEAASTEIPDDVNMKGLGGNPSVTREIFSNDHPYFAQATDVGEIDTFVESKLWKQFNLVKNVGNAKIYEHPLATKWAKGYISNKTELEHLRLIASDFAKKGETVHIMPNLQNHNNDLYRVFFGKFNPKYAKECDLLVGKTLVEYEGFNLGSKKGLKNMISRAIDQSDTVIFDGLSVKLNISEIKHLLLKRDDVKKIKAFIFTENGVELILP